MPARPVRPRTPMSPRTRRGLLAGASAAAVLAATAVVPAAWATHYDSTLDGNGAQPASQFQIDDDANLVVDPSATTSLDWGNVSQAYRVDLPTGRQDDSYSGGVKEDTVCPGQTTGSIPNNKSDLLQFGTYVEDGSPGYLHLYWLRVNEPSGTTLMDFEFNQSDDNCPTGPNKVRTEGDLLIEYSIVQGGADAVLTKRTWENGAWGQALDISAALPGETPMAAGTINTSPIPAGTDVLVPNDPDTPEDETVMFPAASPRTFGEASIDLNAIFDPTSCTSYGSAMLKSRSSDSFTSQLKDFIAPLDLTLTNCGQVKITKVTDPPGHSQQFSFAKSFATDPSSTDRDTFTLADGDTETFAGVLFGTGLTVSESTPPAGWLFDRVDCSASSGVVPTVQGAVVTFDIDDAQDVLDCTFYNKALADLTIVKQVNDDPDGQVFSFTEDVTAEDGTFDLEPTGTGAASADDTGTLLHGVATGTAYTVAETVPAGWNLVSATCDDEDDTDLLTGDGTITLDPGDDVTCTFVNERERGAVEITKTKKHAAAGGTAPHEGVTFTVSSTELDENDEPVWSGTVVTDAAGTACVDGLLYGDYTVTETVPDNYVSDDDEKEVTVSTESVCGDGDEATVSFVNTPLTDVTVHVDSLVPGGTASTVVCTGAGDPDSSVAGTDEDLGDLTVTFRDLEPTAPAATLVCTITVDP